MFVSLSEIDPVRLVETDSSLAFAQTNPTLRGAEPGVYQSSIDDDAFAITTDARFKYVREGSQ
jgi:hypothetical protein